MLATRSRHTSLCRPRHSLSSYIAVLAAHSHHTLPCSPLALVTLRHAHHYPLALVTLCHALLSLAHIAVLDSRHLARLHSRSSLRLATLALATSHSRSSLRSATLALATFLTLLALLALLPLACNKQWLGQKHLNGRFVLSARVLCTIPSCMLMGIHMNVFTLRHGCCNPNTASAP